MTNHQLSHKRSRAHRFRYPITTSGPLLGSPHHEIQGDPGTPTVTTKTEGVRQSWLPYNCHLTSLPENFGWKMLDNRSYSIDDLVPASHPVRRFIALVRRLDFSALRVRYAGRGKPAFPPEAMFGLFVWILERFGPVSLRRMQDLAGMDMTCRLAAAGFVPDHVTLSDFLTRCGDLFATLHAGLLKVLFEEGLLTGKTLVLDGSKIPSARAGRSSVLQPGMVFERLEKLSKRLQELYGRLVAGDVEASAVAELPASDEELARLAKKVQETVRAVEQLRAAAVPTVESLEPPGQSPLDKDQCTLFPRQEQGNEPDRSKPSLDSTEDPHEGAQHAPGKSPLQRSKLADQVKALLMDIQQGQDTLNTEFRRLPRQFHPGDPEMRFVKTAQEGIRPGANLQVLSTEDTFIQVMELVSSPTDQDVVADVFEAGVVQRPAEAMPLTEITTDGGYATWANADACASAGVVLRTPGRADADDRGDSTSEESTALSSANVMSVKRRSKTPSQLEDEILSVLSSGPQRRVHLRRALGIQNARLGDVLEQLHKAGRIDRTPDGWCRVEGGDSAAELKTTDDEVAASPSLLESTSCQSSPTEPSSIPSEVTAVTNHPAVTGDVSPDGHSVTVSAAPPIPTTSAQHDMPQPAEPHIDPVRIPLRRRGEKEPTSTAREDPSEKVLMVLGKSPVPMSRGAIRRAVRIQNQRLGLLLVTLQKRGLIDRVDRSGWALTGVQGPKETAFASESTTEPDLYFQWDSVLETFLCPIGRPMSPRSADKGAMVNLVDSPDQPIPGTYIASGCQICPLAKRCLNASQLQSGLAKRLSVGREALQQEPSRFRYPTGHPAWMESTPAQRKVRGQHAEGRFLVLKHVRRFQRLPYRGVRRNRMLLLLAGMSYNVRRAIDLSISKPDQDKDGEATAA